MTTRTHLIVRSIMRRTASVTDASRNVARENVLSDTRLCEGCGTGLVLDMGSRCMGGDDENGEGCFRVTSKDRVSDERCP